MGHGNSLVEEIKTRPGASDGLWVLFLLPLSVIISTAKHPVIATPTYKLASLLCTGFILTSLVITYEKYKIKRLKILNTWTLLAVVVTSTLFHICFHKGWYFSIISGIICTVVYFKIYISILTRFKRCFTLGEAGVVSQSIVILLYFTAINILYSNSDGFMSNTKVATLIIQFEFLGVGLIGWFSYMFDMKNPRMFYTMCTTIITLAVFLPLHIILGQSPILWILSLMDDTSTIKLMMYWSFCTGVAVLAVSNQIFYAQKASTRKRKIFHILCVAVYVPGLLYRCTLLYLASGMLTGVFFLLEILRLLRMPPLGLQLHDGFVVFSDEKDAFVALTPIYLLTGISLPLWIHPSPCDVTDSALFNIIPLMSGLLSIGIGDSAASCIGSRWGRFHWPKSKKTFEGTAACVIVQVAMIYGMQYMHLIYTLSKFDIIKICFAIVVSSVVEAKTTQVDNLVLPLVMYLLLII